MGGCRSFFQGVSLFFNGAFLASLPRMVVGQDEGQDEGQDDLQECLLAKAETEKTARGMKQQCEQQLGQMQVSEDRRIAELEKTILLLEAGENESDGSEVQALRLALAEKNMAQATKKAAKKPDILASYGVDVGLFQRLYYDILFVELVEKNYKEVQDVVEKVVAAGRRYSHALLVAVRAGSMEAYAQSRYEAAQFSKRFLVPHFEFVKEESLHLYSRHAAAYVHPVTKQIAELELTKHASTLYVSISELLGEVSAQSYGVFSDRALPVVRAAVWNSDLLATLNAAETFGEAKGALFHPFTVTVLDKPLEFGRGMWDLGVLLIGSFVLLYYVGFRFLFRILFLNVFLRFFVYRICVQMLLRNLLSTLVLGLTTRLVSLVYGILLFVLKLACCCGCCGLCFRRQKKARKAFERQLSTVPNSFAQMPPCPKMSADQKRKLRTAS